MGLFQQGDQLRRDNASPNFTAHDIDLNSGAHDGVYMEQQVQDGRCGASDGVRHFPAKIASQAGRFHDKTRFTRCISNSPSAQKIIDTLALCLEGCALPNHLPPFQSLFFKQNFHQSNEASDCISKSHRDQIINFLTTY